MKYKIFMKKSIERKIIEWIAMGRTGASSRTMAFAACGLVKPKGYHEHPVDAGDFNRCLLLLKRVPEVKNYFKEISQLSESWAAIIKNWETIKKCFLEECGFDFRKSGYSPKTYALMKEILEGVSK